MNKFQIIRDFFSLSYDDLASEMNIARSAVQNYINGTREPSLTSIALLCKQYNINANWLIGLEENMFRSDLELSMFEAKELLENRIKYEIKRDFQNFQLQIITIYRAISENEINSKDDIVNAIANINLSFFAHLSNFEILEKEKIKQEAIDFINSLTPWEAQYIVEHRDDFLKTLDKNKDIFNKIFKRLKLI